MSSIIIVPLGNKTTVYIDNENDIPFIDLEKFKPLLDKQKEEIAQVESVEINKIQNEATPGFAPGEKPYTDDLKCKICNKQFKDIRGAVAHCRIVHQQ